jgi:HEAT repeat protein
MMIRSKGTSPFEMGASGEYQIEEILQAANLCGNPEVTLDEILDKMEHPDPGVRYWAVLALQAANQDDTRIVDALHHSIQDNSPSVAIAAAELLCRYGMMEDAIPVLGRYLKDAGNPTVVLQAAISARNIGKKAMPLMEIIEEVYTAYRGEVWGRYKDWIYPMFIGFALDQVYLNCSLELPQ